MADESRFPEPYFADEFVSLYLGDCLDMQWWLNADVLVTDPPYGIGWTRGENKARASKPHKGIANDHDTAFRDAVLGQWGRRPAAVFGSFYAPYPTGVKQVLVWHKPADAGVVGSVTGYRRDAEPIFLTGDWPQRTVETTSVMRSSNASIASVVAVTGHPHTKPIDLMQQIILRCPPGVIADPFAGSGSTLLAARLLGRQAVGVELDERYCETAARRLSQGCLDLEAM